MPFTPFHFGPGIVAKACAPHRFWLSTFVAANVLIDLEVLYYLHHGEAPVHRYLHTYIGGVAMGLVAAFGMFAVTVLLIRCLSVDSRWMQEQRSVPKGKLLRESMFAGLLGGVSHVLLDSLMHHDMNPLWPFAQGNALAGTIEVGTLHGALGLTGFFGVILWLFLR
ncbi:MAG: DUF4184 family protein [Planctomycetaceae bacterium]|nr:DUF4184 family protein [Planctomycetaceae bacterium]